MTANDEVRERLEGVLAAELTNRDASAFVHVGPRDDPAVDYCLRAADAGTAGGTTPDDTEGAPTASGAVGPVADPRRVVAVAYDATREEWLVRDPGSSHPATRLGANLADCGRVGTILTPPTIPHDAALHLEGAGFALASTDAVDRARATKTDAEREAVAAAGEVAAAGLRRGAALLADAAIANGRLVDDEGAVTADRLRRTVDEGIVAAGGFPTGGTAVAVGDDADALRPGEPVVVVAAARGPTGYRSGLARTVVVDGDGGTERRAHVAVTQAFRSARAMLTADAHPASAVEADLEAEIRGFGFGDRPVETAVHGVGLAPAERPRGDETVGAGAAVRLEAAVEFEPGRWIRLADVLARGDGEVEWLAAPSRSMVPSALLE